MSLLDISPLMVSVAIGLLLTVYIAPRRHVPGVPALMMMFIAGSIWSAGYALEMLLPGLATKIFWGKIQYLGIVTVPLAWFYFAYDYSEVMDRHAIRNRLPLAALAVIPMATLILVWTNELHNLVWRQVGLHSIGRFELLEIEHGPVYWIYLIYGYILMLTGSFLMLRRLRSAVRLQRWQMTLSVIAVLLPWMGNLMYSLQLNPIPYLDWTPFAFIVSGLLFTFGLMRFHLVKIMPIAHQSVFDSLIDGIIVLDNLNHIVDINPVAQEMFPFEGPSVGRSLASVNPELAATIEPAALDESYQSEMVRGSGADSRYYELRVSPLKGSHTQTVGRLVALHEITQLKQQQLSTESALRETEQRLRVALSSVPLFVFTCDREQRYTWIHNPPGGLTVEQMLGKRDDEILPPEAVGNLVTAKQKAIDTGQGEVQEGLIHFRDKNFYFIYTTEPMKDRQGNVTGLTCSAIDITEQKQLEIEQQEYEKQISVQRQLTEFRERERMEIARNIHDGPIQTLVSSMFNIQMAKDAVQDPALTGHLGEINEDIQNAISELREVVNELRPPAMLRFGLAKTIKSHADDLQAKHPEFKIHLNLDDDRRRLSQDQALALFRVYQEAMNNTIHHAQATEVAVRLLVEAGQVIMEVQDNGIGFDFARDWAGKVKEGHYGLAGMIERSEKIGGNLRVKSDPQNGTTIRVTAPIS